MQESKPRYFYIWQNQIVKSDDKIVTRTCFGITSDPDKRRNGYEGHVGNTVEFLHLWKGPYRPIKDLEDHLKEAFDDFLVVGHRNFKYEWVNEDISIDQIINWIEWETKDHPSVVKL